MIERNLRYVTVRKYGSAFLDGFGMLPLDYFGCKGDNKTDNYANLQVAINESIKRGLRFIFVPNGTYFYRGTLTDLDKVTFIGNTAYAKIYDGADEIRIYQIGCQMPYRRGSEYVNKQVTEDGYIDIPIPVKNAVEAILVIHNYNTDVDDVLYITNDLFNNLVTVNGSKLTDDNKTYLSADIYITGIEIGTSNIRISYTIDEVVQDIDTTIDWRVR